jgi:peptide/nickel transport system substrate-binding protein
MGPEYGANVEELCGRAQIRAASSANGILEAAAHSPVRGASVAVNRHVARLTRRRTVGGRRGAFGVRTRLGVCAVVLAAIVGSSGISAAQPTAAAPKGKSGRTVTYLGSAEPPDLLPDTGVTGAVGAGGLERFAIYDALAMLRTNGDLEYRLAESIASTNNTVWTVKLRKNLVFSDGTPLDASAVQYNWSRMADPGQRSPGAPIAQTIASTNVIGPTTLEVTLKEPNAQFPALVAQSALALIASPTAWQSAGTGFASSPVGAGPFMLKEWQRGSGLVFERNPEYKGKARLDQIVAKYISDETQRFNTLSTGGGDFMITADFQTITAAKQQANLADESVPANGGYNIFFNLTRAPFDDLRARQAIAYAFDAKVMNDTLNGGTGLLAPTLFLKDSKFFTSVRQPLANKKKAQDLFDTLAREGKTLEFTVEAPPTFQKIAEWFQARLSSFENVTMNVQPIAPNQTVQNWRSGNFTLSLTNAPRFIEPSPQLSNYLETGGATNYGKYSNPEVDAAFKKARTTNDVEERKAAYETVQRAQVKDLPSFFFQHQVIHTLYNKNKIQNVDLFADGFPRWDRMSTKAA